jgi:hypothetical protein
MVYYFKIRRGEDGRGMVRTLLERWRGVWFLLAEFPYKRVAVLL